jgi:hypothetical protein
MRTPEEVEYKPGQPIEELCSAPLKTVDGWDQCLTAQMPRGDQFSDD